jgi:hypothetical protein
MEHWRNADHAKHGLTAEERARSAISSAGRTQRTGRTRMMPRVCTICSHPDRAAIDQALVGTAELRELSAVFRVSEDALWRHKDVHLPASLAKAEAARATAQADDLLAQLKGLRSKAVAILLKAEQAGDLRTALLVIREARACLETLLEVEGELNRRPELHLHVSAEWIAVRAVLLRVLQPYPEARHAVAQALLEVDHARH